MLWDDLVFSVQQMTSFGKVHNCVNLLFTVLALVQNIISCLVLLSNFIHCGASFKSLYFEFMMCPINKKKYRKGKVPYLFIQLCSRIWLAYLYLYTFLKWGSMLCNIFYYKLFTFIFIIPRETEGYRFGLVRLSVRLSVRPSVRLSHPEGGCFVYITSPLMDVPRGFFSSYSIQTRIIDMQRQISVWSM